ncbi:MAG: hypothetical protein OEW90_13455 [Betaproteobacteria bacterium]|nr:hypothetical protein [Betaproteobacteria bacterium]
MAAGEEEVRIRRVVACFAPGFGGRPEPAARLARELEAEFLGLFIEDVELLRFASLPFAREVGLASASLLMMNPGALERQMRTQARLLEEALSVILGPAAAGWSFRVERASPVSAVEAALAEGHAPALLIPPGASVRAERRLVRQPEVTAAAIKEWLARGRPVVVLPG